MLILKVSGHDLDKPEFVASMGEAILALPETPILVHGGGKEIKQLQNKLGIEPQFVDGLRVTDDESLAVVQMVLAGRVNKRLVAELSHAGVDAFGMSGVDRASVKARKLQHPNGDLGQVGEVVEVRTEVFRRLLADKAMPVLSPVCYGPGGGMFNVNADHVATALAVALQADALVFVSIVPGVMRDGVILPELTPTDIEQLIDEQVIHGGMIPKVHSALKAVHGGVSAVKITDLNGLKRGEGTTIVAT